MHTPHSRWRLRRFLVIKEMVMIGLVLLNVLFLAMEHFLTLTHVQLVAIEIFDVAMQEGVEGFAGTQVHDDLRIVVDQDRVPADDQSIHL